LTSKLVVGGQMIFYILWSLLTVRVGGVVIGVSYDTLKLRSKLDAVFDAIYKMHQLNMNMKKQFVSMIK
jgi:hypothetical protein